MPVNKTGIKITCNHCGYTWLTQSKGFYVPCPRCRYQCKIEENILNLDRTGRDRRRNDLNTD